MGFWEGKTPCWEIEGTYRKMYGFREDEVEILPKADEP